MTPIISCLLGQMYMEFRIMLFFVCVERFTHVCNLSFLCAAEKQAWLIESFSPLCKNISFFIFKDRLLSIWWEI